MKEFYHQSVTEVRKQVNGSMKPLTDQQVAEHQKEYGMNELDRRKEKEYSADISGAVQGFPGYYFDLRSHHFGIFRRCGECCRYFDRNYD